MPEIKPTRVFTRDDPCTKVHIWNCFARKTGLVPVMVVASRAEIGLNTPKYLKREGYVETYTEKNADYYKLTPSGEEWLRAGLKRHLELHPEDRDAVDYIEQLEAPKRRARTVRKVA